MTAERDEFKNKYYELLGNSNRSMNNMGAERIQVRAPEKDTSFDKFTSDLIKHFNDNKKHLEDAVNRLKD